MSPRTVAVALVGVLLLAAACETPGPLGPSANVPLFANTAADGNGNKQVFLVNIGPTNISCGTQTIVRNITGWTQVIFDERDKRNVRLEVFHLNFTFTNSAGDKFVWHEVGPDHVYVSDGNLFVAIVGRVGGQNIGRLVVNLATGDVEFEAGKDVGLPRDLACAKLT